MSKATTAASGEPRQAASPRQGSTTVRSPAAAKPTALSAAPVRSSAWITHSTGTPGYPDSSPSAAAAAYNTAKVTMKTSDASEDPLAHR